MLCVNRYERNYVDECRSGMESQLAPYKALVTSAREKTGTGKSAFNAAVESFEPPFFGNLVLVLDRFFVHRARGMEGKDRNPLNEVRLFCYSILENRGVMSANKTIKYNPAKSILKLQIGDELKLTESNFALLFKAFFAEIEAKFM